MEPCEIDLQFDDEDMSIEEIRNLIIQELKSCSTSLIQ